MSSDFVEIIKPVKYDVFIFSVDENNIIKQYGVYEEKYEMNLECVAHFKIECINIPEYRNNYKLKDGELVELSEEEKPIITPQLSEIEILEGKVTALEESQTVQDMLIDDLVFEVIPSIEQQVQQGVEGVTLNNMISRGSEGMAGYLARKIIDGRDYRTVFKTNAYKQYQDEVDTILELEGHAHLIKRDELGVL